LDATGDCGVIGMAGKSSVYLRRRSAAVAEASFGRSRFTARRARRSEPASLRAAARATPV